MPRDFRRFAVALAAVVTQWPAGGLQPAPVWEVRAPGLGQAWRLPRCRTGDRPLVMSAREAIERDGRLPPRRRRPAAHLRLRPSQPVAPLHRRPPGHGAGAADRRRAGTRQDHQGPRAAAIAARLGAKYVQEPQVTVDIAQNRPFFILGEVRSAGQYPYVSGMTVQAAVAIAGGYADRADERRVQITRRHQRHHREDGCTTRLRHPARRHALHLRALALRQPPLRWPSQRERPLRILHCLRAPVGGLFRHVLRSSHRADPARPCRRRRLRCCGRGKREQRSDRSPARQHSAPSSRSACCERP